MSGPAVQGSEQLGVVVVAPIVQSISVANDGSVWAVTSQGQLLQNTENLQDWTPVAGTASWLAVSPGANMVCAVVEGVPMYCDLSPVTAWATLGSSPPSNLETIEIGMGPQTIQDTVYATDANKVLWTYNFTNQNWTKGTTAADQIAATSDGAVFLLNNGALAQFDWTTSQWAAVTAPEELTSVGAGAEGWLWVVGSSGKVYQYDGSAGWVSYTAPDPEAAAVISCGDDTTVWALAGGTLYQFDPSTTLWDSVSWAATTAPTQVSVGSRQAAWALDSSPSGNIYQYTEHVDAWGPVAGTGLPDVRQLSAASNSTLWVVDGSSNVHMLTNSSGAWTASAPEGVMAWVGAAGDGTVWGVDDNGSAYERTGDSWEPRSTTPALTMVSVAGAGQLAAVDHDGAAYTWAPAASSWTSLPDPKAGDPLVSISMSQGGALWAVGKSGLLYLWLGTWIAVWSAKTLLTQVSATGPDNAWAIDTDGNPLDLTGNSSSVEAAPPQPGLPGWDTENPFDESLSTHLWLVNRAATLAQQQGPAGQLVSSLVKPYQARIGDAFHDNLCQGLYDADFRSDYNNPVLGQATYMSHFYDPDTGLNWMNLPAPTAVGNSSHYFAQSVQAYLGNPQDLAQAGYNLGLALHYMTDLTQPMHAANFTYLSSGPKFGYHTDFEGYVMEVQDTVSAPSRYLPCTYGPDPAPFLIGVAENSKYKYYSKIVTNWAIWWYTGFTGYYKDIAQTNIGPILSDAITLAAQYLVMWMRAACTVQQISVSVDATEMRQMCALDGAGTLWHRVWPLSGQPTSWQPVASQMHPDCGPKSAVAVATTGDQTLYVFVIADNSVLYATRNASGAWNGTWSPVTSTFPTGTPSPASIDCTVDGQGTVQVTVLDTAGTLWHTVLPAGGSWTASWGNVAGQESNDFGAKKAVACAGDGQGGLHVVALQKSNGAPWYTYRAPSGVWQSSWLALNQTMSPSKSLNTVSCAVDSTETLQVAALDPSGALWHTNRTTGGSWQRSWGQVSGAVPGTSPSTALAAGAFTNLWLVAVATQTGTPMMAERYPSGSWFQGWLTVGQPPV